MNDPLKSVSTSKLVQKIAKQKKNQKDVELVILRYRKTSQVTCIEIVWDHTTKPY